jgi:CheY-like chemotaxis protein
VASDSPAEVKLVCSLLSHEFTELVAVVSEEEWQVFAQRNDIAVLLLVFTELGAAMHFHGRYIQHRHAAGGIPAQIVMLCATADVGAAYDLCRRHSIFDYVSFWPVTHDPKRLPLAAHRACDAYESLARIPPSAAPATIGEEFPAATIPMPDIAVLVVEDDRFQLAVAISVLISAGLRATGASGGQVALDMLQTSQPALILLDVDMPDMSGLELLRLLKATPRHAGTPVIMLTMMREREMVLEAMRDGAADFIVKPFDRDTLLQKIRRVASREA